MSLEPNRTLGGVGAILLAIPFLNLIGIILVLVAMKGMAEYYEDDDIFKNALLGFIFGVVGVIALIAIIFMVVINLSAMSPAFQPSIGLGLFIVVLLVLYVFSILAAIFYRNSLNILSEESGENMFDTAGLVLLIGAIIPLIGEVLKLVAWILVAVGFFSIKPSARVLTPSPAVSTHKEKKFCQYCGAPLQVNAAFCEKCGKKIG